MVHRHVAITLCVKAGVAGEFISVQLAARRDIGLHKGLERGAALIGNDLGDQVAVTLQRPDNNRLAGAAAHVLALLAPADQRFVNLNGGAGTANRAFTVDGGHVLADFVAHAPCRLVGDAKLALEFLGTDTMARRGEQVDSIEPQLQWRAGLLKRGANGGVQVMPAPLARIGALGLDAEPVRGALALWAGVALSKANIEEVVQAGLVIRELLEELAGGEGLRHAP